MKLEEAIKQNKFRSEIEKAMVNVFYTSSHFHSINRKRFSLHGISPEQYNVLRILRGSHPKKLSILEISSRMLDKNSNATRLVEKLRLKDLIEKNTSPNDRRQVEIGIKQEALALLEIMDIELNEWVKNYRDLSEEEAVQLNYLLDKMRG